MRPPHCRSRRRRQPAPSGRDRDPRSAEAIDRLRKLKHRREKPLALMGRSLEDVRSFFHADELQAEVL
uniref:Sua5/YciO/YrdC/YwlC family protein n=1 Tax=Alistipes shahii TaxID=328814 RepID=UPI004038A898